MAAKGLAARLSRLRRERVANETEQPVESSSPIERLPVDEPTSDIPEIEFVDLVKAAMNAGKGSQGAASEPAEPLDYDALSRDVANQQALEPKAARVAVPTRSWNLLAADSVAKGLRNSASPGRDDLLFQTSLMEPTHLTPIVMTAAAALVLRTGDQQPWRIRAESQYHDHRAIPGLDKAGVMIGLGFTGPEHTRVEPADDGWFTLAGVKIIVHAHLYDALIIRVTEPSHGPSCFLIPIHSDPGVPNGVTVERLFGRPGTAPGAFAEVSIDGARAVRIGRAGTADELLRPAIERLRCDAAMVGAAQMRAAVDALSDGLERRRGADVFHRLVTSDVEAAVAASMAHEASRQLRSKAPSAKLNIVLAQHWVQSRFDAVVPDAAAVVRLAEMDVAPGFAWTSPLLPLWGGTRTVLRADFARLVEQDRLAAALEGWIGNSLGTPLAAAIEWLWDLALDPEASIGDRLEASALMWAASILEGEGRADAAGNLLGAEAVPMKRGAGSGDGGAGERRAPQTVPKDDGIVIDLREVFDEDATSGRDGRSVTSS